MHTYKNLLHLFFSHSLVSFFFSPSLSITIAIHSSSTTTEATTQLFPKEMVYLKKEICL